MRKTWKCPKIVFKPWIYYSLQNWRTRGNVEIIMREHTLKHSPQAHAQSKLNTYHLQTEHEICREDPRQRSRRHRSHLNKWNSTLSSQNCFIQHGYFYPWNKPLSAWCGETRGLLKHHVHLKINEKLFKFTLTHWRHWYLYFYRFTRWKERSNTAYPVVTATWWHKTSKHT